MAVHRPHRTGGHPPFRSGNLDEARERQFRLAPLRIAFSLGSFPVVMKEALRIIGIDTGTCMPPIAPISEENRALLTRIISGMGVETPGVETTGRSDA